MKLVLEAGYDVNARNERMETPLMASVMHVHDPDCRFGVIKLLLASGADINLQNGRGQTVIMYGCILNQLDTVMQLLQFVSNDVIYILPNNERPTQGWIQHFRKGEARIWLTFVPYLYLIV